MLLVGEPPGSAGWRSDRAWFKLGGSFGGLHGWDALAAFLWGGLFSPVPSSTEVVWRDRYAVCFSSLPLSLVSAGGRVVLWWFSGAGDWPRFSFSFAYLGLVVHSYWVYARGGLVGFLAILFRDSLGCYPSIFRFLGRGFRAYTGRVVDLDWCAWRRYALRFLFLGLGTWELLFGAVFSVWFGAEGLARFVAVSWSGSRASSYRRVWLVFWSWVFSP